MSSYTNPPLTAARRDPLGSGWMVVAAVFFALMGALVKEAGSRFHYSAYELVFWRTAFGVAVIGFSAAARGLTFRTPHIGAHFSRSIAGTLGLFFFFYALARLPLATATTLNYTSALFLALLSFIFLKERISGKTLLSLLIGFAGIVVLLHPTASSGQEWAGLVGMAAGLSAGWAYLQVRQLSQMGEPVWRVVFYFSLTAACAGALAATATGWHSVNLGSLLYLVGIGATATAAQLCMTKAYLVGRKFVVAALSYLTVVFSAILGIVFFHDSLHPAEMAGMLLIVCGGIIGIVRR